MNVGEMLKLKNMQHAKLVAGHYGIDRGICGVNVLEATDISNWGRSGEVILTGLFALQDLNEAELANFFEKLFGIGISAVVVKIDRLVSHIPRQIIELCDKYSIPLIQIGADIKYEMIILEILGPIVNHNISLLNRYYEVHGELTKLALKRPSIPEILGEFKKLLGRDVSFLNTTKGRETATRAELLGAEELSLCPLAMEKYMNFKYERREVCYTGLPDQMCGTQIKVRIPYLGYDEYELIVHELDKPLTSEDFMVLENGVKFFQMELLKKFVVSQNIAQQKNNIIGDLLNNRLYEDKDVDEVLESLGINKYKYYQIILLKLYPKNEGKSFNNTMLHNAIYKIKIKVKTKYPDVVFMEKTDRIAFIQNFAVAEQSINSTELAKLIEQLSEEKVFDELYYNVSISSRGTKEDIPAINKEALDTQNVLRFFYNANKIMEYEELGIYKLFLDANNTEDLKRFVAPKIAKFREAFPLLFDTLAIFLDTKQNYNLTAEKLFLHPKTVRYRIDKIKTMLNMDLDNPEALLQVQIAYRLFKLIDGRKQHD